MAGCGYRKKCVLMVFDVCMDGRDVNKTIVLTNAYLAAHCLSGNLKWTLLGPSLRVSFRLWAGVANE